jgi:beta-glucosidase
MSMKHIRVRIFIFFFLSSILRSAFAQDSLIYKNPDLPIARRVDDLISRMTLEEKVSQMIDVAPAIPRLGVSEYNW